VYYISEVLHDTKTRYLWVLKLLYTVLIASRKVHHYFQTHKISVVTSYPLRVMLHNPYVIDNITKWAMELAEFELDFMSWHAVKSQVLADFVWTWCHQHTTQGAWKMVSQSPELWSSPGLTGLSSLMAPRVSREPTWGYYS
jgi:hypothetical protein